MATETAIATVPSVTDPRELALLKAVGLDRVAPEQRELALNIAKRYDLDLLLKHMVLIDGRPYVTRDGLLHIAHRSGQLDGMETSEPTVVDGYWRSTCAVYRKDMSRPFTYTGRYPTTGGNAKFAPEMAVKVGEVMALRRAFDVAAPAAEERWDQDIPAVDPQPRPSLAERAAAKRAEVEVSVAPEPDGSSSIEGTPVAVAPVAEPLGLTKREFVDALAANRIDPEYAASVKDIMWPGQTGDLTPEMRRDLLAELTKPAVTSA